MTVFQQVLWMFVNIRLLGKQPRLPLLRESMIQYAVALELQYSRICMRVGTARRREAVAIAADRWPARADRSRRTSAGPVAGLA